MDIRIKATEYQLTPEVSAYIDDRLAALDKFLGGDTASTRCEVEVGRDAGGQRHGPNMWFAEMRVIIPGSPAVYARNNAENVNMAIDDVKAEIERQLRKQKKFHSRFLRKTGAAIKNWTRFG